MCVQALLLSRVQLFAISRTVVCQAPLSMGFSRQGYWSGLPCPSPDLPDPGIKVTSLASPALDFFLPLYHLGSAMLLLLLLLSRFSRV